MSRIVKPTPEGIATAVALLEAGEVVAFPTETVYGLGASALDEGAVRKVYDLKGRPLDHPLIVHLPNADHIGEWAGSVPPEVSLLTAAFWPGPLTLVLRRNESVPDFITGGQETVALRSPAHPVAQALISGVGAGVAAPSANKFGRVSPTAAAHVASEFPGELLVLDGGRSDVGLESTILDLSVPGAVPRLLRPGGAPVEAIERVLGTRIVQVVGGPGTPRAPGSLRSHYAARARTVLAPLAELLTLLEESPGAAVLAYSPPPTGYVGEWLELPADPDGYGRELYAALRLLDEGEPPLILVEAVPTGAEWLAVRDRLERASAGPA